MAHKRKRKCKYGVNKNTGACLKNKRTRKIKRSGAKKCKHGVSKTTGRCLKHKRRRK